jgi:2-polyprenyl-3-methyl-5-hydroxy-6-metoxy-1,4-benzoquinol methylase
VKRGRDGKIEIPRGEQDSLGLAEWLGRRVDPTGDPWFRFGRVIAAVNSCVAVHSGATWLDVGCQMGQFLKVVQQNYGATVYGIDDFESRNAVEVCRKYLKMNIDSPEEIFDGSWHYFCRRIDQVGFALDKKFDMISALEVLEHMIDTDAFLEECRNHLASAGWLIITTPNINSLRNRVTVPLGTYPNGIEYRTVIHHVRLYNAANLKSHVESHGFRLVKMSGVSFLPRRTLVGVTVKGIDHQLSKLLPSLCGNLIGVFQKLD